MFKEQGLEIKVSRNQYKLLKHTFVVAYRKSKFYQNKFKNLGIKPEDFKTLNDIRKFPFTTKEDLLNFNDDFLIKPKARMLRIISSGGTTSKGKFIFLDKEGLENYLVSVKRGNKLAEVIPGKDIVGITFNLGLTVAGLVFGVIGFQESGILAVPFGSDLDPEIMLNYFRQIGVNVIHAPTARIFFLTEKLKAQRFDLKSFKIRKILLGGALLTDKMRKFIEEAWDAEIFDVYSSTEAPRMALECKYHNGFHLLAPDYLHIEILNEKTGKPVKEGELGEVVITTLKRDCMPLIRYKMNDLARITSKSCPCGLATPRILSPIGRIEERVVFKDFYKLYGHQINEVLLKFDIITPTWQLVVDDIRDKEKIALLIETDIPKNLEKAIKKELYIASPSLSKAINCKAILPPEVKFIKKNSLKRTVYGKIKNKIVDKRKNKFF